MASGAGLKGTWGVEEPCAPSSDKQAREFKAAFTPALNKVKGCGAYTQQFGELSKHQKLLGMQDTSLQGYQKVLTTIDPSDPSKAAAGIQKVLGYVDQVQQKAATLEKETKAAYDAWMAMKGARDTEGQQAQELDVWGDKAAPEMLQKESTIEDQVAARKWDEAKSLLEGLISAIKPVYEEYLRQKAAKETYEPEREAFDGEFAPVEEYDEPTEEIQTRTTSIRDTLSEIDGKVEELDYVSAGSLLGSQQAGLIELKDLVNQQKEARTEYQNKLPGVTNRDFEAPESKNGTPGWQLQQDIVNLETNMTGTAETKDYVTALEQLGELESKNQEAKSYFEQLAEQRQEYEAKRSEIEGRLDELSQDLPAPFQADFEELQAQLGPAAEANDNEQVTQALGFLQTIEAALPDLAARIEEYKAAKEEFEQRWPPLQARYDKAVAEKTAFLEDDFGPTMDTLGAVTDRLSTEDYPGAVDLLNDFEGSLSAFETKLAEYNAAKEEFETRWPGLQTRYDKAVAEKTAFLEDDFGPTMDTLEAVTDRLSTEDYPGAVDLLNDFEGSLSAFETKLAEYNAAKEEFEARWPGLQTRYDKAVAEKTAFLEDDFGPTMDTLEAVTDRLSTEDYPGAVDLLNDFEGSLSAFETKLAEYTAAKAEFEAKSPALIDRCVAALAETTDFLQAESVAMTDALDLVNAASEAEDYPEALLRLGDLEREISAYETKLEEYKRKKADYEARFEPLNARSEEIVAGSIPPGFEDQVGAVSQSRDAAMSAADAEDYDAAMAHLSEWEGHLSELETNLAAHREAEKGFVEHQDEVEAQLEEQGDAPEALQGKQAEVDQSKGQADQSGEAEDFEAGETELNETEQHAQELTDETQQLYEDNRAFVEPAALMAQQWQFRHMEGHAKKLAQAFGAAESVAAGGDYGTAADQMAELEGAASDLELERDKLEGEYNEKSKDIETELQGHETKQAELKPEIEKIEKDLEEARGWAVYHGSKKWPAQGSAETVQSVEKGLALNPLNLGAPDLNELRAQEFANRDARKEFETQAAELQKQRDLKKKQLEEVQEKIALCEQQFVALDESYFI